MAGGKGGRRRADAPGPPRYAGPPPTPGAYGALTAAYDHFNGELFGGRLPPCLLTLRAKGRTLGYFSPGRFAADAGTDVVDELAMNPARFGARDLRDTLSTVAHEMAHVEHQHYGRPGSGGYHNKEFSRLMARIGLVCSDTGRPGGRKTGRRMTHYVVGGGPFDASCDRLMARGFALPWSEPAPPPVPVPLEGWDKPVARPRPLPGPGAAQAALQAVLRAVGAAPPGDRAALSDAADIVRALSQAPAAWTADVGQGPESKVRFTCPGCGSNAWGKAALRLRCGLDGAAMLRMEGPAASAAGGGTAEGGGGSGDADAATAG